MLSELACCQNCLLNPFTVFPVKQSPKQHFGAVSAYKSEVQKIQAKQQDLHTNGFHTKDDGLPEVDGEKAQGDEINELLNEKLNTISFEDVKYENRMRSSKDGSLPEKIFVTQESLLTVLLRMKHIACIYNIFIVVLIILSSSIAISDIMDTGKLNLGFARMQWAFGGLHTAAFLWVQLMSCTLAVYGCFKHWATHRISLMGPKRAVWDYGWLIAYILYQIAFIVLPALEIMKHDVAPASSIALLLEQVRLMMKSHAFVRTCAPQALSYKPHSDKKAFAPCPTFGHFLYFLFAPTLLYRDTYPRSGKIRWNVVLQNLLQVLGAVFYLNFIAEKYIVPLFHKYGKEHFSAERIVTSIFACMIPSLIIKICAFFGLLHSWLNAFAEIMQFGDRMFYKDWWNANSHSEYFPKWNVVVHDWLYTYVYKDFSLVFKTKSTLGPTLCVFIISAIVHEYIMIHTLRFFYPTLFLSFGFTSVIFVVLMRNSIKSDTKFVWLTLISGSGVVMSLYCLEGYARFNCPRTIDSAWDFFVPRSWFCSVEK